MTNFDLDLKSLSKITLSDDGGREISEIVSSLCGIKLGDAKKSMIQTRLHRRLIYLGIPSYEEYLYYLRENNHEQEHLINALTTNKTGFWREEDHYSKLMKIIEKDFRYRSSSNPLYIWSAACSTGEEVYTLAILLEEFKIKKMNFNYKILGTDIDTSILERALQGIYSSKTIKTIPPQYFRKYFYRGKGKRSGQYKIKEHLQENIKFRQHNLIEKSSSFPIKFDIIFLKNVLIYFDSDNIQIVIHKILRQLRPGGYLFIGLSESLNGINHSLNSLQGSIYRKVGNEK